MYAPLSPLLAPRFAGIATFSRLPYVPEIKGKKLDVAVLGLPFDGGTTFRPGARFGPRAVRDASVLCRNYHPELGVDVYGKLRVADAGDVAVNPISIEKTYAEIERRVGAIQRGGTRTICIGGDHSVLLPELRAIHAVHGPVTLIHFDAHTDTADSAWGERFHHGTPIRRAIDEGLIEGKRLFQIGIRGPLTSPEQNQYVREQGNRVLDMEGFGDGARRERFFREIHETARRRPCMLTFDVDGVDPAFAPGTGTPVVGGLTSREALESVRRLRGLRFVAADVVEISPPYDHAELTSLLGAALVFEFLSLMALRK